MSFRTTTFQAEQSKIQASTRGGPITTFIDINAFNRLAPDPNDSVVMPVENDEQRIFLEQTLIPVEIGGQPPVKVEEYISTDKESKFADIYFRTTQQGTFAKVQYYGKQREPLEFDKVIIQKFSPEKLKELGLR